MPVAGLIIQGGTYQVWYFYDTEKPAPRFEASIGYPVKITSTSTKSSN